MLEVVRRQNDDDIVLGPVDPVRAAGSLTLDDVLAGAPAGDFAPWFLELAVSLSESRPRLACHMLGRTGVGRADGLTVDEVRSRVSGHPALEKCLESLLAPVPQANRQHPLALERERKRKEWVDWLRRHVGALGCGEGPPRVYYDIARAFLGVDRSVGGDTPGERVRSLFLGDEELSRVALDGLRRMARRTDLPTLDDLVRLDADGRISFFILPLLAALEEEERTANGGCARLRGEALQRALGSFFLAGGYDGSDPAWYRRALRSDPEVVADAFVKVYRSRIRGSSGVDRHLRALTRDESHGNVARAALPRLMKSFPAKATADQVFYLDHLIPAALKHVERDELASIARRKLQSASLRIGQRARWLATGLLLGDPQSGEQLDHFLSGGSDARVRELAAFLMVPAVAIRVRSLSPGSLAMLVSRLGPYFDPVPGGTDGLIRTALDAVSRLPSREATELLQALLDDENLAAWREPVSEASDAQRGVRLDAEPSCELALLAALRPQLPEGVRVEPEARYAGNRRADLQISFGDYAVPAETKVTSSRDLWTGVTAQLIPRYARDPRSDGYGVYVVFWHGPEHAKIPSPTGKPPRTPDELQGRLTQLLPSRAERKVSVIVLDVSPP